MPMETQEWIKVTIELPHRSRSLLIVNDETGDERIGNYDCRWERAEFGRPFRVERFSRDLGAEALVGMAMLKAAWTSETVTVGVED